MTLTVQPILIDSDAFYKLAIPELLDDVLALLESDRNHCARLPALPHMLGKGRLRDALGAETADRLIPIAHTFPMLGPPGPEWLDRFASTSAIDPGEAQLLAAAAESRILIITADKRALAALKTVPEISEALDGRIIVLEQLLLGLCDQLGVEALRHQIEPLKRHDKMVEIAFSEGNPHPDEALRSYFRAIAADCIPIRLFEFANENPRE